MQSAAGGSYTRIPLGRLRGAKLESRNSQLSISKTDSRTRHNWSGIRRARRTTAISLQIWCAYTFSHDLSLRHTRLKRTYSCQTSPTPFFNVPKRFDSVRSVYYAATRFHTVSHTSPNFPIGREGVLAHFVQVCYSGYKPTALLRAAGHELAVHDHATTCK